MTPDLALPRGFRYAGLRSGVKLNKPDTALIVSDVPCAAAARLTTNRARAWAVERTATLVPAAEVRAVIAVSGNANALSGAAGRAADEAMARGVAEALGVASSAVITSSTGVIGSVMPAKVVVDSIPGALAKLEADPWGAARAIMTTDRVPKASSRVAYVGETEGRVLGIAKGAGMIHPNMATMLAYIVTDVDLTPAAADAILGRVVARTFNRISVDGDQSTNDMVVFLANGAAGGPRLDVGDARLEVVEQALRGVLTDLSRAIAADGEGATRLLTVEVVGGQSEHEAESVARAICRSSLVKSAIFGADPGWGRIMAAAGQALAELGSDAHPSTWKLRLQGVDVFRMGEPVPFEKPALSARIASEEVVVHLDLGRGAGEATCWGCDLTYDYVKINADYAAAVTETHAGQVGLDAHLATFSPKIKRSLLIEALRYIERFRGRRLVVKVGGDLLEDPETTDRIAEDLILLKSVGMHPIVLHGGSREVSRALAAAGRESQFVDGHRVTTAEDAAIVENVLLGKVNRVLVGRINALGGRAVGLSGRDGNFLRATPLDTTNAGRFGHLGQVSEVDGRLVTTLIEQGFIPVVAPVGVGPNEAAFNLDAEDAAAALANAFGVFKLVYLIANTGVQADGERVSRLSPRQAQRLMREGSVKGKLVHILEASLNAVQAGVPHVHLVDGRVAHNLVSELFTDAGVGTLIDRGDGPRGR